MKKSIIRLITAFVLALSLSFPAFAASTTLDPNALGPESSMQLMFAKLQLAQAEIMKEQVQGRMEQIQALQEEQRLISELCVHRMILSRHCICPEEFTLGCPLPEW